MCRSRLLPLPALLTLLLYAACAHTPPAPLPAPTVITWRDGVNDSWHVPLPPAAAAQECGMVVRSPQLDSAGAQAFVDSLTCDTTAILLAEAPSAGLALDLADVARHAPRALAIENGNELELPPFELAPAAYAAAQGEMARQERVVGGWTGDVIMGGVYAVTDDSSRTRRDGTKTAITLALAQCPGCLVGVHLYDPSDADLAWLDGLGVGIAVTEIGSPTGCGTARWQEQADYVSTLRARIAARVRRLRYFIIYQRPSGAGCTDLDTFGIEGKPLMAALQAWVRR